MTDPIITAIQNYRDGLAAFNALPDEATEKNGGQAVADTYGPPHEVLMEWDAPAISFDGAVEALRLARDEAEDMAYSDLAHNMVLAALAFFEPLQMQVHADIAARLAAEQRAA